MNEYDHAIEIAPRVWWVGYVIPDDPFQCHVYLIEDGDESILIDPGSKITWEITRKKIEEIIALDKIRYIICHHQDPDITSCISDLLALIGTKNRYLVTHWRTAALLKHYNWGIDFYEIDKQDWRLQTQHIALDFIFTPYMHFPGAFCSYMQGEQILFSSDIFGAFTPKFSLYAEDAKSYFEMMIPFHTHYMPSREIVNFGLDNIEKASSIELIAPQHGSLIRGKMVSYLIARLRKLDVGLYLEFMGGSDVKKLSLAHDVLSKAFEIILRTEESLYTKIGSILEEIRLLFGVERLVCLAVEDEMVIAFDSAYMKPREIYHDKEAIVERIETLVMRPYRIEKLHAFSVYDLQREYLSYQYIAKNADGKIIGACLVLFEPYEVIELLDLQILESFQRVFSMMLFKELSIYKIEKEKRSLLHKVITDALTNLYNRYYFDEIYIKEYENAHRHHYRLSFAMIDLDHFKTINDTFGHDVGDLVLKDFAKILKANVREGDFAFRYGGEEFVILMPYTSKEETKEVIERIRSYMQIRGGLSIGNDGIVYTFSCGIAELSDIDEGEVRHNRYLAKMADEMLYQAKEQGRNSIVCYSNG